ncbi:MAG: dTDP-glucose 4,6-dehydratase [Conexivisphaera sp.]
MGLKCESIMVTGGMGFIGSNFIRFLENSEFSGVLVNVDALKAGSNPMNLEGIALRGYRFVKHDLSKGPIDLDGIDCVFNFASETHVDRSIADPRSFVDNNVWLILNLLEGIRRSAGDVRLVHASTDEIYGDALAGSFDESSPPRPSNPYSATKMAQEALIMSYVRTYGVDAVIARSSNNFGPYQSPEKLIPKAIIRALMGLRVPIYGSGRQRRSWIYVEDNARAMALIAEKGRRGEVYNVPGVEEAENLELVRRILRILGKDEGMVEFVEDRPGHDVRYSISGERIRALGFRHEVSLEEGLRRTVNWYLSNRGWWEPLIERDPHLIGETPWRL